MAATTKDRILAASIRLFRRQGYTGTGLKEIAAESDAPWGSLYHHFPEGKEQLVSDAMAAFGERYASAIAHTLEEAEDPAVGIEAVFEMAAEALERSRFTEGCPIGAVSLEAAGASERIRETCAETLNSWFEVIERHLRDHGLDERRAAELARFSVAAIEGACVVSRALRDATPMRVTGAEVAAAIDAAGKVQTRQVQHT